MIPKTLLRSGNQLIDIEKKKKNENCAFTFIWGWINSNIKWF